MSLTHTAQTAQPQVVHGPRVMHLPFGLIFVNQGSFCSFLLRLMARIS